VRCFILSSHYRSPLNYSDENLEEARAALQRLYTCLRDAGSPVEGDRDPGYEQRFRAAMSDDFNTREALAVLFDLSREINRAREQRQDVISRRLAATLRQLAGRLGLLQAEPEAYLRAARGSAGQGPSDGEIESLVAAREKARARRDWAEADQLRDRLAGMGVVLEDGPTGTRWRRS
jgi:cysteinyl-tRNA synthetase